MSRAYTYRKTPHGSLIEYGSSRTAVLNRQLTLVDTTLPEVQTHNFGQKSYELTNHLGNVLATPDSNRDDRRFTFDQNTFDANGNWVSATPDGLVDYYRAEVNSATVPIAIGIAFGMPMPGRSFNNGNYRFGFNGQERDDEIAGTGNINTAMFWEYDTRLGRRWNVDPVTMPYSSPYATFENNSVLYTDPNGDCPTCDDEMPDAKPGTVFRPKGTEHDYIKGDDGVWGMIAGQLETVVITAESTKKSLDTYKSEPDIAIGDYVYNFFNNLDRLNHSIMGKSYGEGEDWVKGGGFGVDAKIGFNKYNLGVKMETYSTTENNLGLYFNTSFNIESSLEANKSLDPKKSDEGWNFSSTLNNFTPKADYKGYIWANTKKSSPSTGIRNETFLQAGFGLGPLRMDANTKGTIKLGGGVSTDGFKPKISIINSSTIFDYKSGTFNL